MKRENIGNKISKTLIHRFPLRTQDVSDRFRGRVSSEVNSVVMGNTIFIRDFIHMNERSVWPHQTPEHEAREH